LALGGSSHYAGKRGTRIKEEIDGKKKKKKKQIKEGLRSAISGSGERKTAFKKRVSKRRLKTIGGRVCVEGATPICQGMGKRISNEQG